MFFWGSVESNQYVQVDYPRGALNMNPIRWLASLALGVTAAGLVHAQVPSPKIVISNVTPAIEIPLEPTGSVQFNAAGDLTVICDTDAQGRCPNAGSTGGSGTGTNPPVAFTLTPSAATITQGSAFSLSWNSADSQVCYGESPSGVASWSGQVFANSGSQSLSLTATNATTAATYSFTLRCYSAGGNRTASTATITVNPPTATQEPSAYCSEYYSTGLPTSAAFTAFGFTKQEASFQSVFAVAPGEGAAAKVLPGNFLNPSSNRYLAIPFTMSTTDGSAGLNQFILDWVEAQNGVVASGPVSVSVSPCAGDFRQAVTGSSDAYLTSQCRRSGNTNQLTVTSVTGQSGCLAPVGKLMYINIATYNMFTTTTPTTSNCGTSATCGVSMKIR